jgi:hypothetical protein
MSTAGSTAGNLLRRSDKEVRQILRQRKKRSQTSCLPCRTRKVKCDRGSPCDNCAKRGYPELCSFAAQGGAGTGTSSSPPQSPIPDSQPALPSAQYPSSQQPLPQIQQHLQCQTTSSGGTVVSDVHSTHSPSGFLQPGVVSEGSSQQRAGSTTTGPASSGGNHGSSGIDTVDDRGRQDRREPFLGTNSMRSFLRDQASQAGPTQNTPSKTVEDALLPILGLDESRSTYPFLPASQTSLEKINLELHQVLPVDREIIR